MVLILPVCFQMLGGCVSGTLNLLWCCWGSYYVGLSCCHSSLNAGDCVLSTITWSLLSWWLSSWSEQTSLFGYRGTPLMLSFYSQPAFGGLLSSRRKELTSSRSSHLFWSVSFIIFVKLKTKLHPDMFDLDQNDQTGQKIVPICVILLWKWHILAPVSRFESSSWLRSTWTHSD